MGDYFRPSFLQRNLSEDYVLTSSSSSLYTRSLQSADDTYNKYGQYGADLNGLSETVVRLSGLGSLLYLIITMIVFCLMYLYNVWPHLYASRRTLWPTYCQKYETPPNKRHLLSWLTDTYHHPSDLDIIKIYGMDTCIYLKSMLYQGYILFACSLIACFFIILPINMGITNPSIAPTVGNITAYTTTTNDSMSPIFASKYTFWAVPNDEPHYIVKVYIYILTAYLYTGITIFFLKLQYKDYVKLRHGFLSLPTPQQYSILVDHIPPEMRKNQTIKRYFEKLFPGKVLQVSILLDLNDEDGASTLEKLLKEREKCQDKIDITKALIESKKAKLSMKSKKMKRTDNSGKVYQEIVDNDNNNLRSQSTNDAFSDKEEGTMKNDVIEKGLCNNNDIEAKGASLCEESKSMVLDLNNNSLDHTDEIYFPTFSICTYCCTIRKKNYSQLENITLPKLIETLYNINVSVSAQQHSIIERHNHFEEEENLESSVMDSNGDFKITYEDAVLSFSESDRPSHKRRKSGSFLGFLGTTEDSQDNNIVEEKPQSNGNFLSNDIKEDLREKSNNQDQNIENRVETRFPIYNWILAKVMRKEKENTLQETLANQNSSLIDSNTMLIATDEHSIVDGLTIQKDNNDNSFSGPLDQIENHSFISEDSATVLMREDDKPEKVASKLQKTTKATKKRSLRQSAQSTIRFIAGNANCASAFVTFNSLEASTIAAQTSLYHNALRMHVSTAPDPKDIIWSNVCIPMQRMLLFRKPLSLLFSFAIILFFFIPCSAIAGLLNIQTLRKSTLLSKLHIDLSDNNTFLIEYLPLLTPFILYMIDCFIPPILSVLSKFIFREVRTVSESHEIVFRRFYAFLMYNNFFILVLTSSFWATFQQIYENPNKMISALGKALPNLSSFYMAYILVKAVLGFAMEIFRFTHYIMHIWRWCLVRVLFQSKDVSKRQKMNPVIGVRHLHSPGGFYFGRYYAENCFVFSVVMAFSCICPLTVMFGTLFFLCAYPTYRRQLMFIYEPEYEAGGVLWPKVYRRMIYSLYLMQIALVCMLIAKASSLDRTEAAYLYSATFPVLVLLCLTIIVSNFIESLYFPKSQFLPLNKALDIDQKNYEDEDFEQFRDAYMQPELKQPRDCSLDTSTTDSTLIFPNFINYTNLDDGSK